MNSTKPPTLLQNLIMSFDLLITKQKSGDPYKRERAIFIGQSLKDFRQKAGLTQMEIAKCLGFSMPKKISAWERGDEEISFNEAASICRICLEKGAGGALALKEILKKLERLSQGR